MKHVGCSCVRCCPRYAQQTGRVDAAAVRPGNRRATARSNARRVLFANPRTGETASSHLQASRAACSHQSHGMVQTYEQYAMR